MNVILRFFNGVCMPLEMSGGHYVPYFFHMHSQPEGCTFWFRWADELPNGTQIYKETQASEVKNYLEGAHGRD